jgi:hypothetical protein
MTHPRLIGPALGATVALLAFGGIAAAQTPLAPAVEITSLAYAAPGIAVPAAEAAAPTSIDAPGAPFVMVSAQLAEPELKGEAEAKGESSESAGESDGPGGHADPEGVDVQHEFEGEE